MTTENRLDSIERLLAATAASIQTVAANHASAEQRLTRLEAITEQNSKAIDRLEVQVSNNSKAIDRLEVQVSNNSTAINRLEVQVSNNSTAIDRVVKSLEDSMSDLINTIDRFVEEGERARQLLTETVNADRAEIKRILDYLFGQQNGNGQSNS